MGDLKPGWKRVKFGEIAQCVNERVDDPSKAGVDRYVGLEHLDPESLVIRRWGAPADVESNKLRFRVGDIIFGKRRAYQRKLAVADFEGICSAHAMVLRAKPSAVLPEFLPFFMQSDTFMGRAKAISVGSLSPTINWKTLAEEEFALPPLEEQRRLATLLNAAENCNHAIGCVEASARASSLSLRRHIFGVVQNRPVDLTPHGGMLGDHADFLDSLRVPLSTGERSSRKGPFPYYGASGVIDSVDDFLFDEELLLVSEDGANLTSRSTQIAFVAKGKYWVNNHAHVLRAKAPWTNQMIAAYLESITIMGFVSGTAQPKLTRAACASIPLPPMDAMTAQAASLQIESVQRTEASIQSRRHELSVVRKLLDVELGCDA